MSARRTLPLIAAALLAVTAAALAVPLWPAGAGGSTTYVVTRGASMQPELSRGDLAVLRAADEYRVGDVAGYRNRALDRVVLHRIVAVDGDVYTFQGDANSFRDPEQVSRAQVVGGLAVTVPFLGAALLWLSSPFNSLLLIASATLAVVGLLRRRTQAEAPAAPELLESSRVVAISDMAFPHELPVADVADVAGLMALAEYYDRPVLHDEEHGLLFVIEPTMLFRCRLGSRPAVPLAVVRPLPPAAAGRRTRRPGPRGRDWDYGDGETRGVS